MAQMRYADAVKAYERFVRKNPEDALGHERLGVAYRYVRSFQKAEQSFEKADALGGLTKEGYVNYGQILIKNDKPQEAKRQFEKYLAMDPESFVVRLLAGSIVEVQSWANAPKSYTVKTIQGVNSELGDFCPVPFKGGLAFSTERNVDFVNDNTYGWNNLPYLAVFYAEMDEEGLNAIKRPKNFLTRLYGDYNIGPASIDTLNSIIYFSAAPEGPGKDGILHLGIYEAEIIKDKKLGKRVALSINSDTFSVSHPSITPDGNTLFFASNRPGSKGGMDLFKTEKTGSGWGKPEPLKGLINTELNEVFPYAVSNDHIFFSSDGQSGYGGLDIFESRLVDGSWTLPVNLKEPINSKGDDFGITFINKTKGYFSSERDGGLGRDDIYQFIKIADPDDDARIEVAGIFEYSKLPKQGVTIRLLDEFDNVLEETQTDSLGNFVFMELPTNKNYRVEISDAPNDVIKGGDVYLLNEEGKKVQLLDRINESQFAFKTLPKEEFESLVQLDVKDHEIGTYEIFGQLYSELPAQYFSGMTMIIIDEEGNMIQETITDSVGMYRFDNLSKSEHYKVQYSGPDSVIYLTSVFYEDDNGIRKVEEDSNSLFHLERLRAARLAISEKEIPAQGYIAHDGKRIGNARLMLVDSNNINLRAARTNVNGEFDFGTLSANQAFNMVLPDSIANLPGGVDVVFIDKNGRPVAFATERNKPMYSFKSLKAQEFNPELMAIDEGSMTLYGLNGQVFRTLPGDYTEGLSILAVDDAGRIIEIGVADAFGNFTFTKLQADQHYTFRVNERDKGALNVSIFDLAGNLVAKLRLDELGQYMYQKLNSENASMFLMNEDDVSELNVKLVSGMLYKKLPGDYKEGIMVYAVDENGNILDSAMTDGQGNFKFTRLTSEKDFTMRVMDEEDKGMNVAFYDYQNKLNGFANLDQNNGFVYSKIILEAASELGYLEIEDGQGIVFGRVFKKLPGDYKEGMKVYAYDESGNLIDEAYIDEQGNFQFKKLNSDANYTIRMEDEDDNANFALLDANGNIISEGESTNGEWTFDKLAHDEYLMATKQNISDTQMDIDKFKKKELPTNTTMASGFNTLYYDYKSSRFDQEDSALLASIVHALKADDGRYLRITSHIDPSEISGQRSLSAQRSVRIAQYLEASNISLDRITIENWEELKPINNCPIGTTCSESERARNQRTEINIVSIEDMPTTPDHIIEYEFNQWQLPRGADTAVFGLIKLMKNDGSLSVTLDGYSDTYGTYEANARVSMLRALNLKNILVTNGISEDRVKTKWHGERIPFGGCLTEYPCPVSERKQNRRTEIRLSNENNMEQK